VSSALYVYAIVHNDRRLPLIDEPVAADGLALVPWRELAAVTRRTTGERAELTMDAVRHHEAVVEGLLEQRAALPVRFGTVFHNAASVASAIAEQYEPLAADLQRLGDKVELSLTALWVSPPITEKAALESEETSTTRHAGARYLRARAALMQREEVIKDRARAIAEKLNDALGGPTVERRVQLLPTPRIAVRTTYLLERANVGVFRTAFETKRRIESELRLLLTGPWPPYSFVRRTPLPDERSPDKSLEEVARILGDTLRERRD
jgi:hypothetical protein